VSKTIVVEGSDNLIDALKELEAKNIPDYEVVVAKENELQVDLDHVLNTEHLPRVFQDVYELLQKAYPFRVRGYHRTVSKSGNTHVTIKLGQDLPLETRIAWQACFGSDPRHEALTLIAAKRNVKNPILMFEPKNRSEELLGVPDLAAEPVGRLFREEIAEETLPAGSA
jgi:hypothetical protein